MINTLYDKFKPWSQKGSIWLIGDLHLGDKQCKNIDSNWPSTQKQMNILKNTCNGSNNTLIVLGDVGDKAHLLNKLSCYKVLITGNHDKGKSKYKKIFHEVYTGPLFISDKILLSHEPCPLRVALNLHGHQHSAKNSMHLKGQKKHINLAANIINYRPVNLKTLIKNNALKKIKNIHKDTIDKRK